MQIFVIKQVLHRLQSCDNNMAPTIVMEKTDRTIGKGTEPKNFYLVFLATGFVNSTNKTVYNCMSRIVKVKVCSHVTKFSQILPISNFGL